MFKVHEIASIKAFALASVFCIFAVSAAQAGGPSGGVNGDKHGGSASAAATCDGTLKKGENHVFGDRCKVLATEGPGGPGDGTSRAELSTDMHSITAGGNGGISGGDVHAGLSIDTHMMFAGGKASAGTNPVEDKA